MNGLVRVKLLREGRGEHPYLKIGIHIKKFNKNP